MYKKEYEINDKLQDVRIEGYTISFNGYDSGGGLLYYFPYCGYYKEHRAQFQPAAWTQRLHGNAPAGTFCGSYRIQLPNKKRITLKTYI